MKLPAIVRGILEKANEEVLAEWRPPRVVGSYRASELGDCPRYIQYTVRGYQPEAISPELYLLFRDGHLHHDSVRGWLSKIGILTNIEHHTFKAFTHLRQDFIITATIDGLLNGEYPIDVKSINPFGFKALSKENIREKHRGYVYQLQTYLEIFNKLWGCLIFKDKAFSTLQVHWFKRDPKLFEQVLTKVAKIHMATITGKWVKRPYEKNSTECERCPMRIHCWGKKMKRRTWR